MARNAIRRARTRKRTPEAGPPRLKVLYVEDFNDFLEEFPALFDQNLDIASTQGGPVALDLLGRANFNAVVVDYEMPGMDGLAFMAAVKEKWPTIPVLFCTGQGSEAVARRAFMAGASDYFAKDFSFFVHPQNLRHPR